MLKVRRHDTGKGGKDGKTKVKGQRQQMIAAFPDVAFMASRAYFIVS